MTHCQQLRPRRTRTFPTEMRPMFDYEFETVRSCCVKVAVKFERWVQVDGTKTGFSFLFSSCCRPIESGELFWFVLFYTHESRKSRGNGATVKDCRVSQDVLSFTNGSKSGFLDTFSLLSRRNLETHSNKFHHFSSSPFKCILIEKSPAGVNLISSLVVFFSGVGLTVLTT